MKEVTIDTVRERIARIEECASRMPGGLRLSMNTEFELACLRALLGMMQSVQVLPSGWRLVPTEPQPAPEKYNIGEATMLHIFTATGMTDVSDMQAVFDRVEAVLVKLERKPKVIEPDGWRDMMTRLANGLELMTSLASERAISVDTCVCLEWVRDARAMLNQAHEPATDNTAQQFEALASVHSTPTAAPIIPEGLHPDTADLVIRFATALAEKLHRAEQKYGHANGWMSTGWYDECLQQLWDHIEKGDPRDVAAYCAFMWHHGWVTTDYDRGVQQALTTSAQPEIIGYEHRLICGELRRVPKFDGPDIGRDGCEWVCDDVGTWRGKCGTEWQFFDDGPDENGMKFCPGCGKPVSTDSAGGGNK